MKIFRLTGHPLIRPHIEGIESKIIKYHNLVKSIKPLDQRKDIKMMMIIVLFIVLFQNQTSNTFAYPYRRELDIDHQTDPIPTCRVNEHQR